MANFPSWPWKDVHYMFQFNSAVEQTEGLCKRSLEYGKFLAREPMWLRMFYCPLSGR